MEMLEIKLFSDIYRAKRVLVTGHTGFKGSWLALWLHEMGAEVTGISMAPENQPNHWDLLNLPICDRKLDIRDLSSLRHTIEEIQPEIVFHLAAQSLVRRSYREPIDSWAINVMGTANVLEACRLTPSVRAIVAITSDKCYENREWPWGYREIDSLGGKDPYSASKAAAELVAASYRSAFFDTPDAPLLATARAGNVIGGADWSEDRLIPDLVKAIEKNQSLEIRSPQATRPWQHVLDSLSGYLLLGQKLLLRDKVFAGAWNFGPDPKGNCTVAEVLGKLNSHWQTFNWHVNKQPQPPEATLLYLDSAKAYSQLHWQPVWSIDTTLVHTAAWYRRWLEKGQVISHQQLSNYIFDATQRNIEWARQ